MSDFNDRPFLLGTVRGVRSFKVDTFGRLGAATRTYVFTPGENQATCKLHAFDEMRNALERYRRSGLGALGAAPPAIQPKNHEVACKDCTCGFYAYTDGTPHFAGIELKEAHAVGIVEGYGKCVTVGKRGFRAEKTRVVALVKPFHPSVPVTLVMVAAIAYNLHDLFTSPWGWLAGVVHIALSLLMTLGLAANVWLWRNDRASRKVWPLIRRNYPEVPTYRTLKAAKKAHPLTAPVVATPDDDDFWTRSAS